MGWMVVVGAVSRAIIGVVATQTMRGNMGGATRAKARLLREMVAIITGCTSGDSSGSCSGSCTGTLYGLSVIMA